MRKIALVVIAMLCVYPAYAINWIKLKTPYGKTVYLDMDSIKEVKGYYFYNISYPEGNGKYQIATIQSTISKPLSARINLYSHDQYQNLNGDYENITNNATTKMEATTYGSVVATCFRQIKLLKQLQTTNKDVTF